MRTADEFESPARKRLHTVIGVSVLSVAYLAIVALVRYYLL